MKTISRDECDAWLKNNIGRGVTVDQFDKDYIHGADYLMPPDSGKKTALGRALVGDLDVKSPGLFWITRTGVWPSSENMALFDGYRKSFGESRAIHTAPGHVFSSSDLKELECLFDLALYFYWDSILFEGPEGVTVKTSHDEYISVRARDRNRLSLIESSLGNLGLRKLDHSSARDSGLASHS